MAKEQESIIRCPVIPLEMTTLGSGEQRLAFAIVAPNEEIARKAADKLAEITGGINLRFGGEAMIDPESGEIRPVNSNGGSNKISFGPPSAWNATWEPKGPAKNWREN